MSVRVSTTAGVPRQVSLISPVLKFLLVLGIPLGPNALITIRGRTSGLPRTTPVAIIEVAGRRWIWSPWGEVHWVRNLRAAGCAALSIQRHTEEVSATELDPEERVAYFRDVFAPYVRSMRGGTTFVRLLDGVDLTDPVKAAEGRVVFELHPVR
jgi:deazaflavin-dependent oxidoreductase (nitroreductase family)